MASRSVPVWILFSSLSDRFTSGKWDLPSINPKKCFSLETCTSSVICRFRRLEVLARDNPAEYGAFCSNIQFPVKNEFSLIFFSPISRKRIFVPWLSCKTSYFPFFYSVNPTEDYYLKQTGTAYIRRAKNETQTEKEYHRMNMMVFTNSTTTSIETCAKDRQRVNGTKFFPLKSHVYTLRFF